MTFSLALLLTSIARQCSPGHVRSFQTDTQGLCAGIIRPAAAVQKPGKSSDASAKGFRCSAGGSLPQRAHALMHAAHNALRSCQQLKSLLTSEAACMFEGRAASAVQKPGTGADDRKRSQMQCRSMLMRPRMLCSMCTTQKTLLHSGLGLPGYVQSP